MLPGTHSPLWHASLPTCTSPSRRQLVPAPHEALALGTAFSLAPGSTKFAGTWEMPWWGEGTTPAWVVCLMESTHVVIDTTSGDNVICDDSAPFLSVPTKQQQNSKRLWKSEGRAKLLARVYAHCSSPPKTVLQGKLLSVVR